MRAAATALALSFLVAGCDTGTAASPVFESTPGQAEAGEVEEAGYAVCPDGMAPTFDSIYGQMLSTSSCGANSNSCHSTVGASAKGVGNLMDFSLEAGAVYAELLGPDGGGQFATNLDQPSVRVLRVAPYDAGASMLYIKLTLDSGMNPMYGSGMPLTAPGSVCPPAVEAVATWINSGASFDGGVPLEAGIPADAAIDADAAVPVDATTD
jgi:hypothetical protein